MFRVFADSLVCLHFIMVNYWNERASKRDREFEKGLTNLSFRLNKLTFMLYFKLFSFFHFEETNKEINGIQPTFNLNLSAG